MPTSEPFGGDRSKVTKVAFSLGLLLLTADCGAPFVAPPRVDDLSLREQAISKTEESIRVSTAVPSQEETKSIFGIDLRPQGIQPLWLEIENGANHSIAFLPTGLDPEYFAPLEVAFLYKDSLTEEGYAELADHIGDLSFNQRSLISPGETAAGFVFLNPSDPSLVVEIDLIGQKWSQKFSFLVPVLGRAETRQRVEALGRHYTEADFIEIKDEAKLRAALEELPCCTTDETGAGRNLPLNLILIGEIEEVGPAFVRRMYRYNPAKPHYVFGRGQDFSTHKFSRWVAPQPHTLLFWLTPLRYRDKPIWIAQISTRLGGRFAASGEATWRIEPEVDEARNDLAQDMLYSQTMAKIGFVKGAGRVAAEEPRETLDGSTYHTDGLRAVMVFGRDEVSLAEVDFFDWERLVDHYRKQID
jgi:hypothetical protein